MRTDLTPPMSQGPTVRPDDQIAIDAAHDKEERRAGRKRNCGKSPG